MKKRFLIAVLTAAGAAAIVTALAQQPGQHARTPPTTQEMGEIMRRHLQAQRFDADVSGVVVDEKGDQLQGVQVLIQKSWLTNFGTNMKGENSSMTSDGPFRIAAQDVDSLSLQFWKEGYFAKEIQFSAHDCLPPDWQERLSRGEKLENGVVKRDNLKIVLEKHGPLASLENGGDELWLESSGRMNTWSWEKNYPGFAVVISNWRDESKVPKQGVYILADTDAQSNLLMETTRLGAYYPKRVHIIMKDGDGFIVVPTIGTDSTEQNRSMKEAPEKGYEHEIVLEGDAVRKLVEAATDHTRDVYFYFKTSKGYGKGSFRVSATNRPDRVSVGVGLRFQKDGSRLVATDH